MRLNLVLRAGGRALAKTPKTKVRKTKLITAAPRAEPQIDDTIKIKKSKSVNKLKQPEKEETAEDNEETDFSGRVHSESYSIQNLTKAFESIIKPIENNSKQEQEEQQQQSTINQMRSRKNNNSEFNDFLNSIENSTLKTLKDFQIQIINSLNKDDPKGRIYSKNVRQMKQILSFERWRKKFQHHHHHQQQQQELKNNETQDLSFNCFNHLRKELLERPTISNLNQIKSLIFDFWKLQNLKQATILISYSGHPALIDEILKLENVKKVIAIEEIPEYCIMYTDRWKSDIDKGRFYHIKNDGYWWESYSEVEELGLLDDIELTPWSISLKHPSLFFISQLPHQKRSIQFIMQLISFIPNKNWLFQYGRIGLGFIANQDLSSRLIRRRNEKKYTRIAASTNCLTITKSYNKSQTELNHPIDHQSNQIVKQQNTISYLNQSDFFPFSISSPQSINNNTNNKNNNNKTFSPSKHFKDEQDQNQKEFINSIEIEPKSDLNLSIDEFDCLCFLQRIMFIHSAQSWLDSISHTAAGAQIMYEKLKNLNQTIPINKTPRTMSDQDWINLSKAFNSWPFRPKNFENDLELDLEEGAGN